MRSVALFSVFVLFAGGCGSDDASGGPAATTDASTDGAPDAAGGGDTATDTPASTDPFLGSILGDWYYGCKSEGGGYFGANHLTVTATTVTNTYFQYRGDMTCSDDTKKVARVIWEDAKWTVGDKHGDGHKLDKVLARAVVTIYDSTILDIWNRDSGAGPYKLNEDTDISNKTFYGYWSPKAGETYYDIVGKVGDGISFGLPVSGDMKTEATRPTKLDPVEIYVRKGAMSAGYIEGTIDGVTQRAEKNVAAAERTAAHIEIGATTVAVAPWETWVLNFPNAVGDHACEDKAKNAFINFGFTIDSAPVYWDSKMTGGGTCRITVTKAATAAGEYVEGTFEGKLGDMSGKTHNVTAGSFKVLRKM